MEKVLKLYTYIDGVNDTPFPSEENQIEIFDFTYDAKRMGGAPSISCSLMYKDCLDNVWTEQVYAEFNGEKYFLKQTPTSSYSNKDSRYKHEIQLVSERVALENVYFYDVVSENQNDYKPVTNNDKFTFHGSINDLAIRLESSLKNSGIDYKVVVDEGVTSEEKLISFEKSFFANALQEIYNTYELPYYFVGKTIHIGDAQKTIDRTFEYGIENALLSVTKTNTNNRIVNRITGVGSSDNIPYYYPNETEKGAIAPTAYSGNKALKTEDITLYNASLYAKKVDLSLSENTILESSKVIYQVGNGNFSNRETSTDGKKWRNQSAYTLTMSEQIPLYFYIKYVVDVNKSGLLTIMPIVEVNNDILSNNSEVQAWYYTDKEETEVYISTYDNAFYIENAQANTTYTIVIRYNIYYKGSQIYYVKVNAEQKSFKGAWFNKNRLIELSDIGIRVNEGSFVDGDYFYQLRTSEYIEEQTNLMPSIYRESVGEKRFYDAENEKYENPENGEYYHFTNPYVVGKPKEHIENFDDIKPTIKEMMVDGYRIDMFSEFAYDLNDNDEKVESEDGSQLEYKHPYFFGKLRKLGFNLFDSSIEKGEMTISMTSGHCGACKFVIGVTEREDGRQVNTVQVDENGNLLRDSYGDVRCGREGKPSESSQDVQNDTINNEVWIALKKDTETFSTIMPNAVSKPKTDDTFVILNILLPNAYILAAEKKLENELIKYMSEHNEEKFSFSIGFSRIYLEENKDILADLNENSRIQIKYNGNLYQLYTSSFSYKMSAKQPLPEIKVDLTDEISVSQNALQSAISQVKADIFNKVNSTNWLQLGLEYFVRKDIDDNVRGVLRYSKGLEVGKYSSGILGSGGSFKADDNGNSHIEADYITIRKKATFNEITVQELKHIGGQLILSRAAMLCSSVEEKEDGYYCYFNTRNEETEIYNEFVVGDQARCQSFNTIDDNRYYWRLVTAIGENHIVLSKDDCDAGSDIPQSGDTIVQLGNRTIAERQNAQVLSSFGGGSPYYKQYVGIDSYSLEGKEETRISPNDNLFTGRVNIQPDSHGAGNFKDLPEEVQKSAQIGGGNILRNSGFVGNYESEELSDNIELFVNSELYSSTVEFWDGNYIVIQDLPSVSKNGVEITQSLSQNINLIKNENYVVSFYFKGQDSLFSCGGYAEKITTTEEYVKKVIKFTSKEDNTTFTIQGNAILYDIKLERGTIPTDWSPSILDNDKVADEFKNLLYISQAMQNGNTDIIGGLILSSMLQVGKYKDNILESVTAGVNGGYYNDNSVAFWAGGTLQQAINTVAKFSQREIPSNIDWNNLAKFVATHGGDLFMKGFLYASGILLDGKLETRTDGNRLVIDPQTQSINGYNSENEKVLEIQVNPTSVGSVKITPNYISLVNRYGESAGFTNKSLVLNDASSNLEVVVDEGEQTATIASTNEVEIYHKFTTNDSKVVVGTDTINLFNNTIGLLLGDNAIDINATTEATININYANSKISIDNSGVSFKNQNNYEIFKVQTATNNTAIVTVALTRDDGVAVKGVLRVKEEDNLIYLG